MKNDGGNVITLNRLEVPSNAKFHFSIVAYTFFDIINPFLSETFMQSVSEMPPDFFSIEGIVLIVDVISRRLGEIGKLFILTLGKCRGFCDRFFFLESQWRGSGVEVEY